MSELKPCPFCGSQAGLEHTGGNGFTAICDNDECMASLDWHESAGSAIAAWNTRTDPLLDEMAKALRFVVTCFNTYASERARETIRPHAEAATALLARYDAMKKERGDAAD